MLDSEKHPSKVVWSQLGQETFNSKTDDKEPPFPVTTPSDDAPKPCYNDWASI